MAGKNSNGIGSVYFEPPSPHADGTVVKGRWRATNPFDLVHAPRAVSATAGDVTPFGQRPAATARRAGELLDPRMIAE